LTPKLFVLSTRAIGLPDYSREKETDSRSAAGLGWKPTTRCTSAPLKVKRQVLNSIFQNFYQLEDASVKATGSPSLHQDKPLYLCALPSAHGIPSLQIWFVDTKNLR